MAADPEPRQGGFFYGWVIVAVLAAVGALSMALGTLNFGLFVKPMGDELGIGRSIFGWAQSTRQITSALTAPIVGGLIDRLGGRILIVIAAAITGGAVVGVGFISQGWQLVALYALMGVVGMSGPGALVTTVPVAKWFVRRRGQAMGFMSLGIPIGGLIFVPLTQVFIDAFGWRNAWILLGAIGAGVIVPIALLFIRRQPEDLGLRTDGDPPEPATTVARPATRVAGPATATAGLPAIPAAREERSWTRVEAVRSGTFWRLVIVFSLVQLAVNSVAVHRIPSFMDRGLDPHLISFATALDAGAAGLSTFALGFLTQRVAARLIGAAGFLMLAAASWLTILTETDALVFPAMISFGLGIGALMLMQNYLWADYFGRRHLGSIRGAVMPLTLISGGIGAPLAGFVRDVTGSYVPIWIAAIGLMTVGAAVMAFTPPPREKPASAAPVAAPPAGP